nr:MAG TPA: YopX protein [Caudoviricetes sp.]
MIPKFRAYDSGSLGHMYQPDEVMVCDRKIWIQDEDSEGNEWIVNNDLNLMQSTGLKDKNGKEIFEGDILYGYAGEDFWEIVEFDTEEGKWIRKDIWYNSKLGLSENNEFMEIVGNIYENPELLEVKE